jgi:AcrR family transcriptional regulator
MTASPTPTRTLSTAGERRVTLVDAAVRTFAERGYSATPTTEIAKAAGISQAYLFRLFPTKQELFVAAMTRVRERMLASFAEAAARAKAAGKPELAAMGDAYMELIATDPNVLRMLLHGSSAAACDEQLAAANRDCWREMVECVQRVSGAPDDEIQSFFAMGMLINTLAAMRATGLNEPWARLLCDKSAPIQPAPA